MAHTVTKDVTRPNTPRTWSDLGLAFGPRDSGADRPKVALTVPRTDSEPGLSGSVWGTKARLLRDGGLTVVRLGVNHKESRLLTEEWRARLREIGGLVVAVAPVIGPHIPVDEIVLGQIDLASQENRPIFADVRPEDWQLPEHGMAVTGNDVDHILGEAQITVFGNDVSIIREGLR